MYVTSPSSSFARLREKVLRVWALSEATREKPISPGTISEKWCSGNALLVELLDHLIDSLLARLVLGKAQAVAVGKERLAVHRLHPLHRLARRGLRRQRPRLKPKRLLLLEVVERQVGLGRRRRLVVPVVCVVGLV
jgi:hypothetical protein